jgi:hypothetical protein
MKINSGLILLCASLLVHSSLSAAQGLTEQSPAKQDPAVQQKADAMINKAVAAYGGDKRLSLKGFRLADKRE